MPLNLSGSGRVSSSLWSIDSAGDINPGAIPDGGVTATSLASTLDLSSKTLTLPSDKAPMEIISSSDTFVSGASQLDISIPTDDKYRQFKLLLTGFFQTGDADTFVRVSTTGTYDTGNNYKWQVIEKNSSVAVGGSGADTASGMRLNWYGYGDADGEAVDIELNMYNFNNALTYGRIHGQVGGSRNNGNSLIGLFTGQYNFTSELDGIRIFQASGTISYRSYTLYGLERS